MLPDPTPRSYHVCESDTSTERKRAGRKRKYIGGFFSRFLMGVGGNNHRVSGSVRISLWRLRGLTQLRAAGASLKKGSGWGWSTLFNFLSPRSSFATFPHFLTFGGYCCVAALSEGSSASRSSGFHVPIPEGSQDQSELDEPSTSMSDSCSTSRSLGTTCFSELSVHWRLTGNQCSSSSITSLVVAFNKCLLNAYSVLGTILAEGGQA